MSTVIDARKVSLAFQYAIGELDAEEALQIWEEMNALLGYYPLQILNITDVMEELHLKYEGNEAFPELADEACQRVAQEWGEGDPTIQMVLDEIAEIAEARGITLTRKSKPDPKDPDNFWIDDATGERVNAHTGERSNEPPEDGFAPGTESGFDAGTQRWFFVRNAGTLDEWHSDTFTTKAEAAKASWEKSDD